MQALGVEYLLVTEERLKVREFVERFRLALVTHDPKTWVRRLYPDWAKRAPKADTEPEVEQVEEVTEFTDKDLANPEGVFMFPEDMTPEEAERLWQEAISNPEGRVYMSDLDDEGWQ